MNVTSASLRSTLIRLILIAANLSAIAVLLAIPVGKLFGVIKENVNTATMIGWMTFFVPTLASVLALWGIHFSRSTLTRQFVVVAMPGSFLVALLALFTFWRGPPSFAPIGIGASVLFSLNVVALWEAFKDRLKSEPTDPPDHDDRGSG